MQAVIMNVPVKSRIDDVSGASWCLCVKDIVLKDFHSSQVIFELLLLRPTSSIEEPFKKHLVEDRKRLSQMGDGSFRKDKLVKNKGKKNLRKHQKANKEMSLSPPILGNKFGLRRYYLNLMYTDFNVYCRRFKAEKKEFMCWIVMESYARLCK